MRYAQIREHDVANGTGVRVSFFVTGCTHNCFNCFNKEYQDFSYGDEWTNHTTKRVIDMLDKDYIKGLSILGGEPFQSPVELTSIIRDIKKHTDKDIWIWSGYTFDEIVADSDMQALLEEVDVLIDGKFVQRLKDLTLKFRGSSNQRIIDVKKSLQKNEVILYDV